MSAPSNLLRANSATRDGTVLTSAPHVMGSSDWASEAGSDDEEEEDEDDEDDEDRGAWDGDDCEGSCGSPSITLTPANCTHVTHSGPTGPGVCGGGGVVE